MSRKTGVRGHSLKHGFLQDNFEDASDLAPRPDSPSDRSRSRSLLNRESSSTTVQDARAGSPPPEIAEAAEESDDDADQPKSESPSGEASSTKSPLLTAHRISVTSDMDDVSLDGGESTP
jgi:hypothetical protein